jgi:hypothetical protein
MTDSLRRRCAGSYLSRPVLRLAAVALAALALVPSASAWTRLSSGAVGNTVDPALLRTSAGTELAAYDDAIAGTISLVRNGTAPRTLVSGDPIAGQAQLVQQPSGAIQLYFPNAGGVARLTSTDDGQSWTGPIQTQSHDVGPVRGSAVRADGTPLFSQDGTGFVNVFQGLNGEQHANVFPHCCGYGESLAVSSSGQLGVAFWSNANAPLDGYVFESLDAGLGVTNTAGLTTPAQTVPRGDQIPLVADSGGNLFTAYATGYPSVKQLIVRGVPSGPSVVLWRYDSQDQPHAALAVEPDGYLWAVWEADGAIRAARSRSHGAHFGAQVHANLPAASETAYQLEALARNGSVDAIANVQAGGLITTRLLPGLAVSLKKIGKTWFATVVDDGFGVPGATVRGGGRTLHTAANGRVSLKGLRKGLFMQASHAGYVGTGFRVP